VLPFESQRSCRSTGLSTRMQLSLRAVASPTGPLRTRHSSTWGRVKRHRHQALGRQVEVSRASEPLRTYRLKATVSRSLLYEFERYYGDIDRRVLSAPPFVKLGKQVGWPRISEWLGRCRTVHGVARAGTCVWVRAIYRSGSTVVRCTARLRPWQAKGRTHRPRGAHAAPHSGAIQLDEVTPNTVRASSMLIARPSASRGRRTLSYEGWAWTRQCCRPEWRAIRYRGIGWPKSTLYHPLSQLYYCRTSDYPSSAHIVRKPSTRIAHELHRVRVVAATDAVDHDQLAVVSSAVLVHTSPASGGDVAIRRDVLFLP